MTIGDWVNYLNCMLENYFKPDDENRQSLLEYEELKGLFEMLRASSLFAQDAQLTFPSIKTRLLSLLANLSTPHREDHLQAVRFCSLMPLRSIPAKAVALLGMQESAFPRIMMHSSLNLMKEHENCDYCPASTDFDQISFSRSIAFCTRLFSFKL